MTIKQIIQKNPDFMDYEVCMSKFFVLPDDKSSVNDLVDVEDFPILGVASNEKEKELRFIISGLTMNNLKQTGNKLVK